MQKMVRSYSTMLLVLLTVNTSILLPIALSSFANNVIVSNSGRIGYTSPLHVEGKYIKDIRNETVSLRGVWKAEYADSCVGWWGGDAYNWNEANVRADMQNLRDVWHVNTICTFIWGNWWLQDMAVTLGGGTTDRHYRWAIKETLRIADEYGLYFQIRLWEPSTSEGAVDQPYAPYSKVWSQQDFVDFWANVATELKGYSNVIFTLYDEPLNNETLWFQMAPRAINAIRAAGADQLVVVHLNYCGDCMWMERWIQQGLPTHNIIFSNHIYRFHGTFAYNSNSPTDIDYIRNFLGPKPGVSYTGAGYKYITDTYNIPIWVSAIGAASGSSNDAEWIAFNNTLAVLNEWKLGYVAYQWFRTDTMWTVGYRTPNRVGQALINAITS